jgi:FtsZ-interacting cell division protein ZipA
MNTENIENATKDATVGAQGAAVAPEKAPAKKPATQKKAAPKAAKNAKGAKPKPAAAKTKKATPAKTAAKAPKAAEPKAEGVVRQGTKTEIILNLLRRAKGATLGEIMAATSWQPHSCRGFISGILGKKLGLTVNSVKGENGQRTYSLSK